MAAGLTWRVSLEDAISKGAKTATSSLSNLGKKLDALRAKSKVSLDGGFTKIAGLDTAIPKLSMFARAVQAAGNAFGPRGANGVMAVGRAFSFLGEKAGALKGALGALAAAGKIALTALAAIGGVAIGLAAAGAKYVIEAQAFKQSTMFAFKNLLGSQGAAEEAWKRAKATSLQAGMGLRETASSMNQLLAVGFKLDMADTLIKQMADLKTLNPSANLEGIARAIGQIKNTGRLQGDELMQLADAGLSTEAVYKQLEKQTGKTRAEILKMQAAGKITSDMAIKAIQDSISEQTGRAPGELAAEATRKTLAGAFGKLMAVKDAFVDDLNFDFTPISAFLDKVSVALSGDAGKALKAGFEQLFSTVVGLLDKIEAKDIESAIRGIGSAARGAAIVIQAMADAWQWVKDTKASLDSVSDSIGGIVGAVGSLNFSWLAETLLGPLYSIPAKIYEVLAGIGSIDMSSIVSSMSAKGQSIGSALVQGLLNSMFGGIGSVFSAGMALADAASSGTTTAAQIKSPSRLFGSHADMMVQGLVNRLRSGAGVAFAAGSALAMSASAGSGSTSLESPTVSAAAPGTSQSYADAFPMMFGAFRSPAELATAPSSAASIGTAAANVTNNTTTQSRGDVNITLTANNADESKMSAMITQTLRSLNLT